MIYLENIKICTTGDIDLPYLTNQISKVDLVDLRGQTLLVRCRTQYIDCSRRSFLYEFK